MARKTKPRPITSTITVPVVTPETEEVQELIQEGIEAFNEGDLDTYLSLFTDDVESFSGFQTPLRFEGLSAWRSYIEDMHERVTPTYEPRQGTLRAFNEDVVVANHYYVFRIALPDGRIESLTGRASMVVVKLDGEWRVANQHFSRMF